MAAENEIEELQLQIESKVCGLTADGLKELAEHLQVETKELGRLALSRRIREKIEQDLTEADDKKTLLVGLLAFVNGKPPPLEDATATKVKVEPPNLSEKATEKAQVAETKFSTPAAQVDNCEQEQVDCAVDESLPEDVEDLTEQEETPVMDDQSLSDSEQDPSPQQESAGPRQYPVRNRRPPNVLSYDHLGIPSYHQATTATVSADPFIYVPALPYLPSLSLMPYGMQHYWMTPYQLPVYPSFVPSVPSHIYQYVPPMAV